MNYSHLPSKDTQPCTVLRLYPFNLDSILISINSLIGFLDYFLHLFV